MAERRSGLDRWQLVLGRFAERSLGAQLTGERARMARVLDHLYGREYSRRGTGGSGAGSQGGHGDSVLTVPEWIREVRDLFPSEVCEVVTRHALERYGMHELVTDAEALRKLEPNVELLKAILTFKGTMQGEVLTVARAVVRRVVDQLRARLETAVRRSSAGRRDHAARSRTGRSRDLDFQRTLQRSLRHWDPNARRLLAAELSFRTRVRRRTPWEIVILVDCSGSMIDSVIHAAVMAGIFHALPTFRVRLCAFDTQVVDLSDAVDDPVEVLMSVQLGGGTDIAGAVEYGASLITQPSRTIVVLVTDFFEGGSPARLVGAVKRLRGAGVRVLGLAALDAAATPQFDHRLAAECAAAGADVAALTPEKLAEWIGRIVD